METLQLKKRKHESACFKDLHEEITLEIFTRLPVKSVLRCAQVCKTWGTLILNNSFADMHHNRQLQLLKQHDDYEKDDNDDDRQNKNLNVNGGAVGLGLLLWINESGRLGLHYTDLDNIKYDDDGGRLQQKTYFNKKILTRMDRVSVKTSAVLVGSCNGLICFSIPSGIPGAVRNRDPFYIFNPISGENVKLSGLPYKFTESAIVSGFGYHASTNKYKVVVIVDYRWTTTSHVLVYTLGDASGWRFKEEIAFKFPKSKQSGIYMNGALHWLEKDNRKIVTFDLGDEEFHLLPPPPNFVRPGENNSYKLLELGRCLCAVRGEEAGHASVDVWSLKKKGNCGNDIKEHDYHSWSWTEEFSIARKGPLMDEYEDLSPFALTERGKVLLKHNGGKAISLYDPKTTTTEKLMDDDMGLKLVQAIPHMNSFASLSALGVNSKRIRRSRR